MAIIMVQILYHDPQLDRMHQVSDEDFIFMLRIGQFQIFGKMEILRENHIYIINFQEFVERINISIWHFTDSQTSNNHRNITFNWAFHII